MSIKAEKSNLYIITASASGSRMFTVSVATQDKTKLNKYLCKIYDDGDKFGYYDTCDIIYQGELIICVNNSCLQRINLKDILSDKLEIDLKLVPDLNDTDTIPTHEKMDVIEHFE